MGPVRDHLRPDRASRVPGGPVSPHRDDCVCTRCCDLDAMREQPVAYTAQAAEYARGMRRMTASERERNCGHSRRDPRTAVCPDCGDSETI